MRGDVVGTPETSCLDPCGRKVESHEKPFYTPFISGPLKCYSEASLVAPCKLYLHTDSVNRREGN